MGYYTYYTFSVQENKYNDEDIIDYMYDKMKKDDWFYPFSCSLEDSLGLKGKTDFGLNPDQSCKWYEHDEEMTDLSRQFPENIFCLYGEGEETGDLWYTYYKNGKKQYCPARIEFDEYDETKLT